MIATAHVCRTVTRRLERLMVRLDENEPDPNMPVALKFVNRLSDFCYVLARKSVILQKKEPFVWKK
jgi:cob(I)alamin adenosyltransferase